MLSGTGYSPEISCSEESVGTTSMGVIEESGPLRQVSEFDRNYLAFSNDVEQLHLEIVENEIRAKVPAANMSSGAAGSVQGGFVSHGVTGQLGLKVKIQNEIDLASSLSLVASAAVVGNHGDAVDKPTSADLPSSDLVDVDCEGGSNDDLAIDLSLADELDFKFDLSDLDEFFQQLGDGKSIESPCSMIVSYVESLTDVHSGNAVHHIGSQDFYSGHTSFNSSSVSQVRLIVHF